MKRWINNTNPIRRVAMAPEFASRPIPRYCEFPGCKTATKKKKPMCTAHILHMPYVKKILSEMGDHGYTPAA